MISNVMIYLILIGVAGLLRFSMKHDKIISWAMFFYLGFLFADYALAVGAESREGFSFLWNSSQIGKITIDFRPAQVENQIIIPLFFMALMTCLNNNVFRYEEKRSLFNALIILNFVAQSMLIASENYVQLITAVFVSDILGYLILKDVDSSRRYVIYNLFADMCLFMVLALVRSKIQSLEINALYNYEQIGRHKDFVGIVTFLAVFIKTGGFLFQSYLLDLSATRFQRMSAVNLLFSPLSGMLVMVKMHKLLTVSGLFAPICAIMCVLTIIMGLLGAIIANHIEKKTIYLNIGWLGLLLLMLQHNRFEWCDLFSAYYLSIFFFNILLFKIYLYQNRQLLVSEMLNSKEINTGALKAILLTMILLANLWITVVYDIAQKQMLPEILAVGILQLAALGLILNHIYKSPHTRRLDYLNANPLRGISFIVNLAVILGGTSHLKAYNLENIVFIVLFCSYVALPGITKLRHLYEYKCLQETRLNQEAFRYMLIKPLMSVSRMLWRSVDFVLSEKLLTASFSTLNRWSVALFFKINQKNFITYFAFILLGIAVFIWSFYRRQLP